MPRKRKPPVQMQVEGLSTWVTLSKTEYDDFTGKPIAVKAEGAGLMPKPESITAFNKRMREEAKAKELEAIKRYVEQRDKAHALIKARLNPPEPEPPKPAYNQVHTQSGLVLTVPNKSKAWRRL